MTDTTKQPGPPPVVSPLAAELDAPLPAAEPGGGTRTLGDELLDVSRGLDSIIQERDRAKACGAWCRSWITIADANWLIAHLRQILARPSQPAAPVAGGGAGGMELEARRELEAAQARALDLGTVTVNQALEIEALRNERDGLRVELLNERAFNEGYQEHVADLRDAMWPFVSLVKETSGRIPTERLSFANWSKLTAAYDAAALALAGGGDSAEGGPQA